MSKFTVKVFMNNQEIATNELQNIVITNPAVHKLVNEIADLYEKKAS